MEVYQVFVSTDQIDYGNKDVIGERVDFFGANDLGLFSSLSAADRFIDKNVDTRLDAAMADGDGAWISAYPKDDDFSYDNVPCTRSTIMIDERKYGQFIRMEYYVKRRIIEEVE